VTRASWAFWASTRHMVRRMCSVSRWRMSLGKRLHITRRLPRYEQQFAVEDYRSGIMSGRSDIFVKITILTGLLAWRTQSFDAMLAQLPPTKSLRASDVGPCVSAELFL
jgi:hypothetical protein